MDKIVAKYKDWVLAGHLKEDIRNILETEEKLTKLEVDYCIAKLYPEKKEKQK